MKLEVYRLTASKKRSNKHWQAKINVHLEDQYSMRINAKFKKSIYLSTASFLATRPVREES